MLRTLVVTGVILTLPLLLENGRCTKLIEATHRTIFVFASFEMKFIQIIFQSNYKYDYGLGGASLTEFSFLICSSSLISYSLMS